MPDLLQKSSYFYELPKSLIAQYPLQDRPQSRLMLVNKQTGKVEHKHFYDIIDVLHPGDVLVINKTKVIPARLLGVKTNGTPIEVFLLNELSHGVWQCLVHPGKRIKIPQIISFSDNFRGFVSGSDAEGVRTIEFENKEDFWHLLDQYGHIPLPPYIERNDSKADLETYQTVYAREKGSVAAPTAGLHFNQDLLNRLEQKGIIITEVILHVGLGTFRPVKTDDITKHKMHSELCKLPEQTALQVNSAKQDGRRVIAVGTTSVRTLESFAQNGTLLAGEKWTDIFIYPGKKFSIVDGMLTNFHLPESTLIMLVAALAGYELTMQAYRNAVQEQYRFFSYGDAMLIL